jgi:hypothetical protein
MMQHLLAIEAAVHGMRGALLQVSGPALDECCIKDDALLHVT